MTMKILCVADGGVTVSMMQKMKGLEQLGAEVTIVEDADMTSMAEITDRMGLIEHEGVDAAPSCQALLDNCADKDVIVVHVASVNKAVIERAANLRLVAVLRGGYENADVDALRERGIPLVNAPWRSANAVADFTVGMMIAENKNIARSFHLLKEGVWCKEYANQAHIHDMRKCTVGIVGFGNIGSRVAQRLRGFESRILVFDPYVSADRIEEAGAARADTLEDLLAQSDFVTLHMRISESTHHMINAETLKLMKPTAYLVNTARADLVDEAALAGALRAHAIGGAAIDVYEREPLAPDHPYLSLDNITLTSHLAGTSADTMETSVEIGVEELTRFLTGGELLNRRA
jgi:D-3-phosphoglycerate dehydrogenase